MKRLLPLLFILISIKSFSQWNTLNIPSAGRYDDVFFINDTLGWAAGGPAGTIYNTINGGKTWNLQFQGTDYLRSIEFATPTLGFCGSLNSSFYKTTNGGKTWIDIGKDIPGSPGICGLSAPTKDIIYGCGVWSSPAYVIKSIDGGITWKKIDLSTLANGLVEIHFINADTGFVSGMANPATDGGIILYTEDGGNKWAVKHKTLTPQDYIWKLQTPDGVHFFGSVEALPVTGNVRMVKSDDGGKTWVTKIIKNGYSYIQTIGFINEMKGWTGGDSKLYETTDGGINWKIIELGSTYNRFFKVNDSLAFLTGAKIYKYSAGIVTGILDNKPFDELHTINIYPNPVSDSIHIEINFHNKTNCKLLLFSSDGKLIKSIYEGSIQRGEYHFSSSLSHISPQFIYVILKTNEGLIYRKIIKT